MRCSHGSCCSSGSARLSLEQSHDSSRCRRSTRPRRTSRSPASREDVEQFTGFRVAQIEPSLEGLPTHEADDGRTLCDVPRGELPPADTRVPARFLPPFDSIILAHRDRSRILPDEYRETVIRRKNATTLATFTVDGFVAGSWQVERVRGRAKLTVEPFAPIPRRIRQELDAEGERLVAFYES